MVNSPFIGQFSRSRSPSGGRVAREDEIERLFETVRKAFRRLNGLSPRILHLSRVLRLQRQRNVAVFRGGETSKPFWFWQSPPRAASGG